MTALRVLHVDPERRWGGGEEQVVGLVRHLIDAGHRVTVAADPGGRLAPVIGELGAEVRRLRIRHALDIRAAIGLRALVARADVVHFHTARAHSLALWLGRGGGRRVVTRRMDYPPRPRPYVRALYNRCVDRVVAISARVRDVLVGAGVEAQRIEVIASGVALERFAAPAGEREAVRWREWRAAPSDVVVLVVGALVARKGHGVLLAAARRAAGRGVTARYAFCGEGDRRLALETQVRRLGLSGAVTFMGWRSDIPQLLAAADVVALPSRHEGLGVAALEAMAAARPVIASRVGGLAEAVVEEETGWLVDPGDAPGLAAALEEAVRDRPKRERLGEAGRRRVASRFSMERMAAENEKLYRTLV
jgi:glycosyltransferase involved in cell wall biosynthesis